MKSAAVTGVPSWNLAPLTRWKVHTVASALASQLSAASRLDLAGHEVEAGETVEQSLADLGTFGFFQVEGLDGDRFVDIRRSACHP